MSTLGKFTMRLGKEIGKDSLKQTSIRVMTAAAEEAFDHVIDKGVALAGKALGKSFETSLKEKKIPIEEKIAHIQTSTPRATQSIEPTLTSDNYVDPIEQREWTTKSWNDHVMEGNKYTTELEEKNRQLLAGNVRLVPVSSYKTKNVSNMYIDDDDSNVNASQLGDKPTKDLDSDSDSRGHGKEWEWKQDLKEKTKYVDYIMKGKSIEIPRSVRFYSDLINLQKLVRALTDLENFAKSPLTHPVTRNDVYFNLKKLRDDIVSGKKLLSEYEEIKAKELYKTQASKLSSMFRNLNSEIYDTVSELKRRIDDVIANENPNANLSFND